MKRLPTKEELVFFGEDLICIDDDMAFDYLTEEEESMFPD
jgi:hypothetical protein